MSHTNIEPSSLQDAKYYLSLCKPSPDAELLDELVRRFPQHAKELTDFAIDLALDAAGESEDSPIEVSEEMSSAVAKAMSRFNNRLYVKSKASAPVVESPANPF